MYYIDLLSKISTISTMSPLSLDSVCTCGIKHLGHPEIFESQPFVSVKVPI